jgi:G:T-mismatch repair DNA endonuclease (very short patch repair protein)
MADVHTKKQRSYNMSRIRAKNSRPEIFAREHPKEFGKCDL